MKNKPRIILRSSIIKEFDDITGDKTKGIWLLNGGETKPSENMKFGSLCHCIVLEPEKFAEQFIVCDESKRTNLFKARKEQNPDKIFVDSKTVHQANMMKDMIFRTIENSEDEGAWEIGEVLKDGNREEVLTFDEEEYGSFTYRIKPDAYLEDVVIDYKTTGREAMTASVWAKSVAEYGYDIQVGFYSKVLEAIKGQRINKFYHIVQSTVPPYLCSFYIMNAQIIHDAIKRTETLIYSINSFVNEGSGNVATLYGIEETRDKMSNSYYRT